MYEKLGKYAKLAILSSLNEPKSLSELGIFWYKERGRFYKEGAEKQIKEAIQEAKESMLDFTENKLFTQIKEGNLTAIIFYLKTQGKARGYIEKQEIGNPEGESFKIEYVRKTG